MPELYSPILFVQSKGAPDDQRKTISAFLNDRLGVDVEFARCPDDVAPRAHYEVVITPTVDWLPQLLHRIEGLKWVHFLSAGVDRIWEMDVDWAQLTVTKSSGVHAAPMSEYAIGAMLYFAKRFDQFVVQSHQNRWHREWLDELSGRQLLIVGMGAVGMALAARASAFGMDLRCVARTRRVQPEGRDVWALEDLPRLLPEADYIALAIPLTPETRGLGNADFFAQVKPGAVLIDMSRGGVVEEYALLKSLDQGTLRGAALDVFEHEPLPPTSSLWDRDDILLTPHVAGTTPYYMDRAVQVFAENAEQYVCGRELPTRVRIERGY